MSQEAIVTLAIICTIMLATIIYCLHSLISLRRRFKAAFGNLSSSEDLAQTIITYFEKLNASDQKLHEIQSSYQTLSSIASKSIQKIGLLRFNPFKNTGGDQSFVLALLDNHDNGFLLTSIHGREGTRIYIKPVKYGQSEHSLSQEESVALTKALSQKDEAN